LYGAAKVALVFGWRGCCKLAPKVVPMLWGGAGVWGCGGPPSQIAVPKDLRNVRRVGLYIPLGLSQWDVSAVCKRVPSVSEPRLV
jgi:hypothetical protein